MTKDELLQALDDGRLEFAPPLLDASFSPGTVQVFFREVLLTERELCGVTEESLITDFADPGSAREIFERVRQHYGIDCESLPNLKVASVLRACEDAVGNFKYH
jgi:hypothetical protein